MQAGASAGTRGQRFAAALGGPANLRTVDACTTRLRLTVAEPDRVDEAALKALGARGVIKLAGGAVQVVLGPIAVSVAKQLGLSEAEELIQETLVEEENTDQLLSELAEDAINPAAA